MLKLWGALLILTLATGRESLANGETNAAPALAAAITVTECVHQLETWISKVESLQIAASNQATRVQCLAEKLDKIKGLLELARVHAATWATHVAEKEPDLADSDLNMVATACDRAEKLFAAASQCQNEITPIVKKRRTPSAVATKPEVTSPIKLPTPAVRDETTCLKQVKLAELLIEAMGEESATPVSELSHRAVEPLGGWQNDECVTVDDLCVVVARLLNLKVEHPEDPYHYVLAVRNNSLPVDTLLPRRRRESTPAVLFESEVRAFLARGYAAPMASSRRLIPD